MNTFLVLLTCLKNTALFSGGSTVKRANQRRKKERWRYLSKEALREITKFSLKVSYNFRSFIALRGWSHGILLHK
jgi:hypothetical protein